MQTDDDHHPVDPFSRLETAANAVMERAEAGSRRIAYERGNRLSLLWIHGIVGSLAGIQQLLYGSATQIETVTGPHARLVMGPLAFVGGVILILGLTRTPRRSIPMEAVGLTLIALWDLSMTCGLLYARLHQNEFHRIPFGQPLPQGYVPAYPVAVYAGMFGLLVVHLWTLRLLRRDKTVLAEEYPGQGDDEDADAVR